MKIHIYFDNYESLPAFLEVVDNCGEAQTILWDESDLSINENECFINDAYFSKDVAEDFDYETTYIKENVKSILEDYENNNFYKKIEFIDDKACIEATFIEADEDINKKVIFQYQIINIDNKSSDKTIDNININSDSLSTSTLDITKDDNEDYYNKDYYENGQKYISLKTIDKLSTAASEIELSQVKLDLSKTIVLEQEKTQTKTKTQDKSDFDR